MGVFEILRAMPSLEDVSDDAVRWLAGEVLPHRFAAGDVLIAEGGLDRHCYFFVSGEADVFSAGNVLGRTGPGQPEGEMAMFLNRPRMATTVALSDVETLVLSAEAWDGLRAANPTLAHDLQEGILRHLVRRFSTQ